MRIGHGYDVHRFCEGRALTLGGVRIDHPMGLAGHSDADVAVHALIDAMLGALAMGDIGAHFPPGDPEYRNIDSTELLTRVARMARGTGFELGNADVTVVCEEPKLRPYIAEMRERLAAAVAVSVSAISVKATTEEGLGFTGEGRGIAAHAVCLMKPLRREGDVDTGAQFG